ncbi:ABC transporter permease [Candidatus Micrarchaeota archaeon]|nr:ABC transporter permease [Candidatus Micrarchaeota archaeon]MBU1681323.1 ABC transporter permease [Candidatus Micrarchaeota archaeon]
MRILYAIRKELLETMHDHTMLAALILFPVFVMLLMGSAFGSIEIQGLPVGVVGPTNTSFSSVLFSDLNESPAFNLINYDSESIAMTDFRNGKLRAIIIVPEDFESALGSGDSSEVRIAIDNSDIALQEAILAAMGSVIQASSTNFTRSYVTEAWEDLYVLNQSAADLTEDLKESRSKMEQTRAQLVKIQDNMSNIDIGKLEGSLNSAANEIVLMQGKVSEQNDSGFLNKSEEFLYNASFAVNHSIDTVGETHEKLVDQKIKLDETIDTLDTSISALEFIKSSTSDNLTATALEINILTLESLRNTSIQQAADIETEILELESLNVTLQSFRISLEGYGTELNEVKTTQSNTLGEVLDGLTSLNASLVESKETITKLKVLFSEINSTTNDIDNTLEEVLEQTSSVDALISSLQGTVAAQTAKDPETIAAPLSVKVENQYVRNSFVDFILPRVIAVSLMFSCFLLASISVVREKTGKTIVRLLMMPGALGNVVIAKMISITLISLGQIGLILVVALLLFAVAMPENIMMVILGTVMSALVLSSVGIIVGFYARSESAAIQTSLLIAIPMLFLGNILFSPDLLPVYTQALQQLLPLSHITNLFKIVLITNGDPSTNLIALGIAFAILGIVQAIIVMKRRDISQYI